MLKTSVKQTKGDKENLTSSFTEMSICDSPQKSRMGGTANFAYEPQLFSKQQIADVTNGKKWHDLSPGSKVNVN